MERENIIAMVAQNIPSNTSSVKLGIKAVDPADMKAKYFVVSLNTPGADPAYETELFLNCFAGITGVCILDKK